MNPDENRNLPERSTDTKKSMVLGNREIPLEGLSDEAVQELRQQHAKGLIDVDVLAQKHAAETQTLAATLGVLSQATHVATRDNSHITLTHMHEDSLGKTEIITGNTETARKGKLTRTQSGLPDYTLAYIIAAVIIIIVLVSLLKK